MRKRIVQPQFIAEVEEMLSLARFIQKKMRSLASDYIIDPVSLLICNKISRLCVLETQLLAITLVRYSDLRSINLHRFLAGIPQTIVQSKTSRPVKVQPLFQPGEFADHERFSAVRTRFVEKNALTYSIHAVTPRNISAMLPDSMNGTHIFRHLRACWYKANGVPEPAIRQSLGHGSKDSIKSYIHNALVEYFTNNK